jgi:hypothetical protein
MVITVALYKSGSINSRNGSVWDSTVTVAVAVNEHYKVPLLTLIKISLYLEVTAVTVTLTVPSVLLLPFLS